MPGRFNPDEKRYGNIQPIPSILIVEDDGLTALSLQQFLNKSGYDTPDPIASGEEVIEYLKKSPAPDLILMDVSLGGRIDGIETARYIRNSSGVPVIFLTAHNNAKTLSSAEVIASKGIIMKPFVDHEVLSLIGETLNR